MQEHDQKKAYAFGLLAVLLWSTVATAFKLALGHLRPEPLVFYAGLISTMVIGVCLILQGRAHTFFQLTWTQTRLSMMLGALNPFLYYLVLLRAYDLLRAQEAQALNYTWAITMTILAIPMLGQRVRGLQWLAIGLSYSGVLLISTQGNLLDFRLEQPLGFALAMGSTVIWAVFWLLGVRDTMDPTLRLFLNFCFGTAYSLLWLLFRSIPLDTTTSGLLGAAYIGTFEMGITFLFWMRALKLSRTTAQISNLIYLSPLLSMVFIHVVLNEHILPSTLLGLGLILGGTVLQKTTDSRAKDTNKQR